jgi:hypothetical protein
MAYTPPTVDSFYTRFPEFADKDEELVQMLLDEAGRFVDNSWIEADYAPAIRLLAAHFLQASANGSSSSGESETISVGPITIRSASKNGSSFSFDSTPYGVLFEQLMRSNVSGPLVV